MKQFFLPAQPVNKDALTTIRSQGAASLAGLLAGLLLVPISYVAAGSADGTDLRAPQPAGSDMRLVQGRPTQKSAMDQVQELIQQAAGLQAKGAVAEAALLWQQILAILEREAGPEHPLTATSLNNLAFLYFSLGRYRDAEPLYKRSLAIREKALGTEHPDTASSLNNLALLYDNQGRYGEAEPLYKRALAIIEKVLGPEHSLIAPHLNNPAVL